MIAVTGGAGFIGSHLVERVVAAGARVRLIEKPGVNVDHMPTDSMDVAFVDIRDRCKIRTALTGCDTVYHLAANPNLWTRDRADFEAINHGGSIHVLEGALAVGVKRILHTSTESILTARADISQPFETAQLDIRRLYGPYTKSKLNAEDFAFKLARAGAPVVVANPTLPVGPGDRGLSPPTRMTLLFCRGKMPMYLDCRFNMIDVRDVALGLTRVLERGRPNRRYILGAHNIRLTEWLAMLGKLTGRKPPKFAIPYAAALAYAWSSEFVADWFTGRMPEATVTGVKLTRHKMHFDTANSLAELGVEPRPLADSAAAMIGWFKSQKWIG